MSVVQRVAKGAREVASGRLHPGRCPICGPTLFHLIGDWHRDEYRCRRCGSIPRQRAIIKVLHDVAPRWRTSRIFESSPSGPASAYIKDRCAAYEPSQLFSDMPSGTYVDGVRREDLQELTLPNASVDVVVTQDVLEHVLEPDRAFREIARVLVPGGVHVFTVPIFPRPTTVVRAEPDGRGGIRNLLPEDFHGNPLGGGSLVTREWGEDIVDYIAAATGHPTTRYDTDARRYGLLGTMKDVFVTRRPA
ncbi:MAG TPA: methyltransferase domain-containing protein [Frankiaceae bacterium]|nr:methyltransferase domain-containing protein [Frankiaceae bacterium]